jgi:hypothetical protein
MPTSWKAANQFMPALDQLSRALFVVWLVILYMFFGLLVVLAFSTYQLQFSIQSAQTESDRPLTLWAVLQMHREWKLLDARISDLNKTLAKKQSIVSELRIVQQDVRGRRIELNGNCSNKIMSFHRHHASEILVFVGRKEECSSEYFNLILVAARKQNSANAPSNDFVANERLVSAAIDEFSEIQSKEDSVNAKVQALDGELRDDKTQIAVEKNSISELFKSQINSKDETVGDFLNSLSYLESLGQIAVFGIGVPDFSKMPSDMLTLILVLAMGALGGTIHLTRIYFYGYDSGSSEASVNLRPSYYLFRPLLGAITALSIYILVKSGVLVISAPTPGMEGTRVSPYFISFLGIISGLLAEQALDTIQSAGNRWFVTSNRTGMPRWAYGLGAELGHPEREGVTLSAEEDKRLKDLRSILDVSETEFEAWLKETDPVPHQHQKTISAFLNKPERELFSDIPPNRERR